MKNRRNYYRILHVQPDAPRELIRSSYRALMRTLEMHPDRGGDHWNAALLNEAYATLYDTERRRIYDQRLGNPFQRSDDDPAQAVEPEEQGPGPDECVFCGTTTGPAVVPEPRCATCDSPLDLAGPSAVVSSGRRAAQRISRDGSVRYYTDWPSAGREANLQDLSAHGARLLTRELIPDYAIVKLHSAIYDAVARVVACRRLTGSPSRYEVRLQFFTLALRSNKGTFLSTHG